MGRRKISHCDIDLDPTMPNINYNVFKFQVPRSILRTHTNMQTHGCKHTDAHTDPNEYSIVRFATINATIISHGEQLVAVTYKVKDQGHTTIILSQK